MTLDSPFKELIGFDDLLDMDLWNMPSDTWKSLKEVIKSYTDNTPPGWYDDECAMAGCTSPQSGLDGKQPDYCDSCAEWMAARAELTNAVLAGEIAAFHVANCPSDCLQPRPEFVEEDWADSPPEAGPCPECGSARTLIEVKHHEEAEI